MIFGPATTALHEIKDSDYVRFSVLALSSIFFLVDPFAAIGTFMAVTAGEDREPRPHGTARRADLLYRPDQLRADRQADLSYVRDHAAGFEIAGGLILLLIGIDMLEAKRSPTQESSGETEEAAAKDDAGIMPLGIPMLSGPGAISSVMVLVGQAAKLWEWIAILGSSPSRRGPAMACW